MLRLSNLRIGTKLAISSGIALLLVVAIVGSEYLNIKELKSAADGVRLQSFVARTMAHIQFGADGMQTAVRKIQLAHTQKDMEAAVKDLTKYFKIVTDDSEAVISIANSNAAISKSQASEWRNEVQKIKNLSAQFYKEGQQIAAMQSQVNELRGKRAGAIDPLLMAKLRMLPRKSTARARTHAALVG